MSLQAVVREDDPPLCVDLEHAHGQRRRKAIEQLLSRAKGLLGSHLLGDVDHLGHDAPVLGIAKEVVIGDLEPDPRAVLVLHPLTQAARGAGANDHFHPVLDRERVIVGVQEIERALALRLLGAPSRGSSRTPRRS